MICFISNINMVNNIQYIRNIPCVLLSMSPTNNLKGYYNISNFIILANNILQDSGNIVGNGVRYVDPIIANMIYESPDFDRTFMNYIDSDINLWLSMMTIMINAYEGYDVIIEYNHDEFSIKVIESLIKIIQEKYQYNCIILDDIDDLYSYTESSFGPMGLMKLDEERKRYQEMIISKKINYIIGDIPVIEK